MDKIRITVLPGGIVKIDSSRISAANHLSADRLVRGLEEDLGGTTRVERKRSEIASEHHHQSEHELL